MKEKILIIEDELIIASDIQNILEKEGYVVVGVANRFEDALKLFTEKPPDIVISDIYLKGKKSGIDAVKEMLNKVPVPIIFITAYSSNEIINLVADFNSITYITKPFTSTQILAAVKMVSIRVQKSKLQIKVTHREQEIIDKIILGLPSSEIAKELKISVETVKTHRRNIFTKFNVSSVAQLVHIVLKNSPYRKA